MKSLAIEREFGSGGREIGMKVAEKAGIPYYDGELLMQAAEKQGVSVEMLQYYDEQHTGSFMYDLAAFSDFTSGNKNTMYEFYDAMETTIRRLDLEGPAVFIGRCATEILKDRPKVLKAFIYNSDNEKRLSRIEQTEHVDPDEAARMMKKKDKQRMNYFHFWTKKEWKDSSNYDVLLNTSVLTSDDCAGILYQAIAA